MSKKRLTAKEAKEASDSVNKANSVSLDFILERIKGRIIEGTYNLSYPCLLSEEDLSKLKDLGYCVGNHINVRGQYELSISWDE